MSRGYTYRPALVSGREKRSIVAKAEVGRRRPPFILHKAGYSVSVGCFKTAKGTHWRRSLRNASSTDIRRLLLYREPYLI